MGRATPGRVTPWMRPTGAEGRTAWPSSPPYATFCHEASRDRKRSPSLTPIEDRATVTAGGATRRQPPSQSPPARAEGTAPGADSGADSGPDAGPVPSPVPFSTGAGPGVPA